MGGERGDDALRLGSVMGPHPYPWMVRDFKRVVGDERRRQCREVLGGADPDPVVACVGGGSNAIGTRSLVSSTPMHAGGVEAERNEPRVRSARRRREQRRTRSRARHAFALLAG